MASRQTIPPEGPLPIGFEGADLVAQPVDQHREMAANGSIMGCHSRTLAQPAAMPIEDSGGLKQVVEAARACSSDLR